MIVAVATAFLLQAASPQVVDGVIVRPQWIQTPAAADLAPPPRTETPPNASVELLCRVGSQGVVSSCRIEAESPTGRGFGATALSAARHYRHSPVLEDGRSAEGLSVRIAFRWTAGG